jgi:hypothetical protein
MSCPFARNSRSAYQTAESSAALSQAASQAAQSRRSARLTRSQSYAVNSSAAVAASSNVEQQVIQARQPLQFNEREQVQAGQYRGTLLNRAELAQFRGPIPLEQYRINDDSNPEVIRKRLDKVRYTQEVAVRYLNPPQPPKPGDLVIVERQSQIPPAPPVVLRQEACQPKTPPPQVYREAPPRRPAQIPQQVVEVEGTPVPPPARRVVLEKLTSLPPKPQNVLIEKWLPYKPQKRRVVYQRSCRQVPPNPRNLVIEWEAPDVEVEKVCRELGVVNADPEEYVRRYGNELRQPNQIPDLCPSSPPQQPEPCPCQEPAPLPTPTPCNVCNQQQAVSYSVAAPAQISRAQLSRAASTGPLPELEGDVDALRRVNLEQYGLSGFRRYIN